MFTSDINRSVYITSETNKSLFHYKTKTKVSLDNGLDRGATTDKWQYDVQLRR